MIDIVESTAIEELLTRRLTFFQKLIQTPSLRGDEENAQMLIREELEKLGLYVVELRDNKRKEKGRTKASPIIVGILKGSGGGRSIILNAHMDTAPTGPIELWNSNPFSGEIRNGFIYGRGSWDDKAGCIAILLVLDTLRHLEIGLKGDIIVESVIEDEYSGDGTKLCIRESFKADAALIIDGHYDARYAIGHPGHLEFQITLYGQPAPSCRASSGQSAIEKAYYIIHGLQKWSDNIHREFDPIWQKACEGSLLNIGKIQGGEWVGAVPAKCTFEGLMRFAPPYDVQKIKSLLYEQISRLAIDSPRPPKSNPIIEFGDLQVEPMIMESNNPFFQLLDEQIRTVMGKTPEPHLCPGWSDLSYFHKFFSIPCCMFGPGKGFGAHRPNEYFQLDQLIPHIKVILGLIFRWCGTHTDSCFHKGKFLGMNNIFP